MRKALRNELINVLSEAFEYFDDRADADCDETGFIPNAEMHLLTAVKQALELVEKEPEDA